MSIFNRARELAQQNAETAHDMNDTTSGGGGRILIPAGEYFGYLCEYVETGHHADSFEGKYTGDFMKVRLGVAIFHDQDEENQDAYEIVRPFPVNIKTGDRAGSVKIFRGLNLENDADIKTIAEFLGVPRRFKVVVKKNKKGKEFNDIDFAATGPATFIDAKRKTQFVELPDIDPEHVRVFFWNNPTLEDWEGLFIEKANFIQTECVNAVDFHGSALETLLETEGVELPELGDPDAEQEEVVSTDGVVPEDDTPEEEVVGKPARPASRRSQTGKSETVAPTAQSAASPSKPATPSRPRAVRAK